MGEQDRVQAVLRPTWVVETMTIHCPCGLALVVEEFPATCPKCGTRYDHTQDGSRLHMMTVHDYPDAVDVLKEGGNG